MRQREANQKGNGVKHILLPVKKPIIVSQNIKAGHEFKHLEEII